MAASARSASAGRSRSSASVGRSGGGGDQLGAERVGSDDLDHARVAGQAEHRGLASQRRPIGVVAGLAGHDEAPAIVGGAGLYHHGQDILNMTGEY